MDPTTCPDREQLTAYLLAMLSEEEGESIAQHMAACPACEATVASLEPVADTVVARLRLKAVAVAYTGEPEFGQAVEAIQDLGPRTAGDRSELTAAVSLPEQLGEYQILAKLGQGGMGTVYKAVHTRLRRTVAIKILPKTHVSDPMALARFEREMAAVGSLDHPNIVRAYDAREIDGTHFLVMEYVDGLDLGEIVHRRGALPVPAACHIIRQAALGLHYAHEHGLVHRDVKPANLMLSVVPSPSSAMADPAQRSADRGPPSGDQGPRAVVKILDLGLALLNSIETADGELTSSGTAMGTADYMAPEQATDSHTVDIRADIYALGCTFYKLLTGQSPFSGPRYQTRLDKLMGHVRDPIPPAQSLRPGVPDEVAAVLDRMLAKDPAARYATSAEVAAAISSLALWGRSGASSSGVSVDLAALLASSEPSAAPTELTATDPYTSSPRSGTDPRRLHAAPPVSAAEPRRTAWFVASAVLLAMLGGGIYFGIIVRIKHPDGSEQEMRLSDASQVSIEQDGKEVFRHASPQAGEPANKESVIRPTPSSPPGTTIAPQPPPLAGGEPLSPVALVARPAEIPGVQSWTIETRGHRGAISALTYSPDGRWLASAGWDRTIRLWDPATGRLVRALAGHGGANRFHLIHANEPMALAWSPDGKTLASLELDGGARLWDRESGRVLHAWAAFQGQGSPPELAWSPTGKLLASVGSQQVRVWDVETGKCLRSDLPEAPRVCWSPDGKALALAGGDRVQVFDAESGKPLRDFTAPESSKLNGVAWSGDGKRLAARGALACCWDAQSGRLLKTQKVSPDSTGNDRVVWSPDSKTIALNEGDVKLWDPESDEVRLIARTLYWSHAWAIAWSRDGKMIASGTSFGTVEFFDAASGLLLRSLGGHLPQFQEGDQRLVAWSPDSTAIAIQSSLWEAASGKLLKGRNGEGVNFTGPVAWSPDGKVLASGGYHMKLVDPQTQKLLRDLEGPHEPTFNSSLLWSSDNKMVAAGRSDGTIRLWDASSGKAIRNLKVPGGVLTVALSPDNATLVSSADNGALLFWDVASGNLRWTRKVPADAVWALAWSPAGNLVAAGCRSGAVQLWDGATGEILTTLRGAKSGVLNLSWSQDGKTLLAGSQEGDTRLWEAASGELLRVLNMPSGTVSPDGRLLAAPWLNTLRLWEVAGGRPLGTMVLLQNDHSFAVTADGHFRGHPIAVVQRELIYLVQTGAGQETLTPEEFAKKYGWKNDPQRVRFDGAAPAGYPPATPRIAPDPDHRKPGDPIVASALVSRPAAILGVRSWTLDTREHRGAILAVACSPDGRWIATAGCDRVIRLRSAQTGQVARLLTGHLGEINGLSWSPDGRFLASANGSPGTEETKVVILWDPESGRLLRTLSGLAFGYVRWSPDGKTIAYDMLAGRVCLYDISSRKSKLVPGQGPFAWSPDARRLVLKPAGDNASAAVVDVQTGEMVKHWKHENLVRSMAWSPDGKTVASSDESGTTSLWDPATGQRLRSQKIEGWGPVAFSPDGSVLVTTLQHGLCFWDMGPGGVLKHLSVGGWELSWHPDGKRVAVGNTRASLKMVEVPSGKVLDFGSGYDVNGRAVGISPDGAAIALSEWAQGATFVLTSIDPKAAVRSVKGGRTNAWSPGGDLLAVGENVRASIWRSDLGERLAQFDIPATSGPGHVLAWSSGGKYLAVGGWAAPGSTAIVYDTATKGTKVLAEHGGLMAAAWSPDGTILATGGCDGKTRLWNPREGKLLQTLEGQTGKVAYLAWSDDGKRLASAVHGSTDPINIRVWEVSSGKFIPLQLNLLPNNTDLALSPDGTHLANAADGETRVWDLTGRQEPKAFRVRNVTRAVFSSDGKQLTTFGPDNTVRQWDLETGLSLSHAKEPGFLTAHADYCSKADLMAGLTHAGDLFLRKGATGEPITTVCVLGDRFLYISPQGHYTSADDVEADLVYVVETEAGQEMLTREEFSEKYGWKNDPSKVSLTDESAPHQAAATGEPAANANPPQPGDRAKPPRAEP